ncbi:MAG: RNA 2',3'-cyclic phosphodiesterase [Candidatus Zixiibacteriota bacterium]
MRSFIAINLPDDVKAEIDAIIDRLRPAGPPARWVPATNLHLTLKFLDEIREDQVQPITDAIARATAGARPFEIRLGGFGVFPNERKARVFWIAIESGFDILKPLATAMDDQLAPLGFAREARPFSAHITLARLREPGPADRLVKAASHMSYRSDPIPVREIDLMRSILSPKGAAYSVLSSVALQEPADMGL